QHRPKCVRYTWNGCNWCRRPVEGCSSDPTLPMGEMSRGVLNGCQVTLFTIMRAISHCRGSLVRGFCLLVVSRFSARLVRPYRTSDTTSRNEEYPLRSICSA